MQGHGRQRMLGLAGAAMLASCGGPADKASDGNVAAPAPVLPAASGPARPAAFAVCMSCHNVQPGGRHGVGPNLVGVIGSTAGSKPGFAYSDALKNSGITWTAAEVDRFILAPQAMVPGTKMVLLGPKDPAARKAITDYLAQLR